MNIGMENLEAHERVIAGELLKMGQIEGVRILDRMPTSNVSVRLLSKSKAFTRMTSASSSMRKASPSVSVTIVRSRCTAISVYMRPTVHPVASTTASKTHRRWLRR